MKTALITGISGQDGQYLAETLLEKNYNVVGTSRNIQKAAKDIPDYILKKITLIKWDLLTSNKLDDIINEYLPEEIYNFAGISSGLGVHDNPEEIMLVNGYAVEGILESIRQSSSVIKFCQASSSLMFGNVTVSPQSETTDFNPQSPYAYSKLYAHDCVNRYREKHGIFACSAILFNHESPRRGLNFVTKKITKQAVRIKLNLQNKLELGDTSARRDWLHAKDAVMAIHLLLQSSKPSDYVIASGIDNSVEDFCRITFEYLGLNYKDFVVQTKVNLRNIDAVNHVGNINKILSLGWKPQYNFKDIVKEMVDSDLKELKNNLK